MGVDGRIASFAAVFAAREEPVGVLLGHQEPDGFLDGRPVICRRGRFAVCEIGEQGQTGHRGLVRTPRAVGVLLLFEPFESLDHSHFRVLAPGSSVGRQGILTTIRASALV